MTFQGECLCGGIAFQIEGPLAPIQICHCSQCRRAQGTPFVTNIPVPVSALTFERGEDLLKAFESTPGKQRVFCRECGSPIFSRLDALPDVVRIRAGLLSGDLDTRPAFHIYYGSRANWLTLDDGLPRHDSRPQDL